MVEFGYAVTGSYKAYRASYNQIQGPMPTHVTNDNPSRLYCSNGETSSARRQDHRNGNGPRGNALHTLPL
jgi:hypothetical protein